MVSVILVVVILLAIVFDFINGFHDTANSIATSVSTRVLTPRTATLMSASLNFVGALISVNVANTIASGIVNVHLEQYVIASALCGAIVWNLITWYIALPSSSSHALIGSLIGSAVVVTGDLRVVNWMNILDKVIIPLFTSPFIGFVIGFFAMKLLYFLLRNSSERFVNKWFSKLQIGSAALMAFSHGSNDAQKTMGIITLALVSGGFIKASDGIPLPVKLVCALSMALGTSLGGWRIIKTVGMNMIKLQPVEGFAAETSAAAVIQVMTSLGAPVSTTHVISSSIMGVGSSKRFSAVRWATAKDIVATWFITIPATILLGAAFTFLFRLL
ncbi:inorganic phosphate transporter [Caproiciproducens galactitolivorans]|uniref:Low-affinity inorganic phosphate transporter 1 n=1 Tax=Caproiciproducens galactitolivorans TaxID=642589 RepID=A0A4Z0Y093_9FIRM|nr:inorganic phosphate transporter [Caproiciproducens galactitolivorans]QEY33625.1 inorganic phosphate transporter [Caproiciproducens galactitolivorans]TGJ76257.1 Low-affinity inorganic phosphate transporter 1 [Caproiciproducens galactitolivorans]